MFIIARKYMTTPLSIHYGANSNKGVHPTLAFWILSDDQDYTANKGMATTKDECKCTTSNRSNAVSYYPVREQ